MARGFFCGELELGAFDPKDIRKSMPRFEPENYAANLKLLAPFEQLAKEAGCSPAQLALAWLLHKDPNIIPIPGTTSVEHLMDDLASVNVKLSPELIQQLDQLINEKTVVGNRYNDLANSEVDTEFF